MKKLMDSKYKLTVLVLLGLVAFCGLPFVYANMTGDVLVDLWPLYQSHVKDLGQCNGLDAETGRPLPLQGPLQAANGQLRVCAMLEVDYFGKGGYPVVLDFLWRYGGETVHDNWGQMYRPGYIVDSWELEPRKSFLPGQYRVDVYHGRALLASTEFTVTLDNNP